jgi:hypothetical protein
MLAGDLPVTWNANWMRRMSMPPIENDLPVGGMPMTRPSGFR